MFDHCYGYIFSEYQSELDKITRWFLYLKNAVRVHTWI